MPGRPSSQRKQVRFARAPQEEDEETLFEKRGLSNGASAERGDRPRGEELPHSEVRGLGGRRRGRGSSTLLVCSSFLGLGMSIAILGPTFNELAVNVNKNISEISYIFVGRSLGYVGGSLIGGVLFDCTNHYLLLGSSMLITSLGLFAIPWCTKALLLTGLFSLIGVSMGFLDTGGNLVILTVWGNQADPFMQAAHFSFALGAFVAPILAKPLLGILQQDFNQTKHDVLLKETSRMHVDSFISSLGKTLSDFSPFVWTYVIIGTFNLLIALMFFIIYSKNHQNRGQMENGEKETPFSKYHNALIFLLFFFFLWYVGAEVAYGSYIYTYAKNFVHMEDNQAAGLNALFWGTFAATRGLAIPFAACIHPGTMILLSLIGCTISSLFLTLYKTSVISLWVWTGVYGASMATTFPSGISWLKQYTSITGKSAALFVVGAALGEMVVPAVVGYLQGLPVVNSYPVLMLTALGTATMTAILFPVMYKLASSTPHSSFKASESEDRKALLGEGQNEYEDDEPEDWNDADFEVIEMSDVKNGTDRTPVGEASTKSSEQASPSHSALPHSSPVFLGGSPKKALFNPEREKND
ncbi:sodium-dependent glucose transporter 1 [Callorhinchus milii]|uniref:Major facilitator superfamily domain containing 4B n=1 Tax=Callorhinchus milii TaxID=7868 RepID=A0A4W3J525_CALMI|nr:sodium-dependent glucose transporter 1 [Callorhinchus milii]|eukprot:gi/632952997/ref/XP_007892155.1/ PREDICTED: sodium-dependent glucose transporter 1 [Callorhinchus milii]